jgi:L-seryl-tRNA(Ser) seleniumtransferase
MDNQRHPNPSAAELRDLPSVDHLLNQPAVASLMEDYPRAELVHAIRAVLAERRNAIVAGAAVDIAVPGLALAIRQRLYRRARRSLRKVINATGIVLHTGLGRAPLPDEAIEAINDVAAGYCNLEFDLASGQRGSRYDHARELLRELTGAEDGIVVNNNAAATFLVLNTFGAGREAIISRGQLVEIGGSYRLPDIMAAAHCRMVEVGTTNRTRICDYENAISDYTAMLMRVHCSNYRIVGFTESATLAELVALADKRNLLVVDDLGSGFMSANLAWPESPAEETDESAPPSDWDEPSVIDSVAEGADLTLFSGDKLLGGPQAGIIIGRSDLIAQIRRNPLTRTVRPDKLTLAGLEATLRIYRDPANVAERIPGFRLLARPPGELGEAAHQLAQRLLETLSDVDIACESDDSEAGGGSLAALPFPTWVVAVRPHNVAVGQLAAALRERDVPIICRIREDALVFDIRTLSREDTEQIPLALAETLRELSES